MRVLVIPSWYPDAVNPTSGIFVAQQVQALKGYGVDVAVLFPAESYEGDSPRLTVEDGVLCARTGWSPSSPHSLLAKRLTTLRRLLSVRLPGYRRLILDALLLLKDSGFEPDLVHVHALWHAGAAGAIVSRSRGVPIVVTEHSEEYSADSERMLVRTPGILPLVLRPLARRASGYIAVSNTLADRLRELGIYDDIHVIPNVVPGRTTVVELPRSLPHRILHVSQLGHAKNIPLLMRAVEELSHRRQDFVLEIGGDSVYRADAEVLARELRIDGTHVRFLGRLEPEQVLAALDECVFAVLSSRHENSSVFAAEALMSGRPLLTTACGGHVEYLDDSLGLVVENDSVTALADGLDWMLDHHTDFDPEHLSRFAHERFSPDAVCRQLVDIYETVLHA